MRQTDGKEQLREGTNQILSLGDTATLTVGRPFRNAELYRPRTGLFCMEGPEVQGFTFTWETVQNPYSCRLTD